MSSSWREYAIMNSPSHKKIFRDVNAVAPDVSYQKEQMRIERKRKQQEEIAERRYTMSYGTAKEKEKY